MQNPIEFPTSVTDDERDCEVEFQQMEPNVGTTTRGESASLRSRVNQPLVRRYFREYKSLFQELIGDEFTTAEIEKMAMDEA